MTYVTQRLREIGDESPVFHIPPKKQRTVLAVDPANPMHAAAAAYVRKMTANKLRNITFADLHNAFVAGFIKGANRP